MRDEIIGLSDLEVLQSRAANGTNRVTAPPRESLIKRFMERLSDPIIIILIVALTLSVGVAIYQYFMGLEDAHIFLEPLGIFVAILLATLIGFLFEMRANKKFELLNSVSDDTMVKVMRSGQIREVAKCDVVVGDIIHLDSGDEIPSDAYLLEATSLQVNESSLTGEPMTHKCVIVNSECQETTYPQNLILRGTTIIEGHAVAKVIRVGDSTEYGKVYRGSQIDSGVKTPLNMQLDKLAKLITLISYIVAFVIIVGRMWIYFSGLHSFNLLDFGSYFLSTIMIAVTVIVVSVPEGLPMSVSLSLALSIQRMLKANNLVRKMHACETMGATTVICTDKTGTLTQNKMQIFETKFSDGVTPTMISKGIVLNSTAHLERCVDGGFKVLGNPTEGALLLWLEEQGEEYLRIREESIIVSQLPFSTERKYMASVVKSTTPGKNIIYVKGAPEVIVALSKGVCKESIEHDLCNYQSMAMRTLGFAYAEINDDVEPIKDGCVVDVDLIFVGIVAISDPIRTDVPEAVIRCRDAGIAIKIVTGDTMATAQEIARQIGLWGSGDSECNHLTGSQFEALSDEDLLERLDEIKILSRARPMDKQRMVKLLQQRGEVVAVTGDGTNDAPALKAAQIGLSMGDGTLVAKQASDITILDNSFSTISQSVMWGRSLYQNIQRFILFQLTINLAACLVVLIGSLTGGEPPLTVTQMLWVNLIMDTFAALALASLPPSPRVMLSGPRRESDHIITSQMSKSIVWAGLLFAAFMFGLMQYFRVCDVVSVMDFSIVQYFDNYLNFSSPRAEISPYEQSLFFTIFVMLQFWNMFNARAFMSGKSAFSALGSCRGFLVSSLLIVVGQWLITTFGGAMFGVVPLNMLEWFVIIVATSLVMVVGEIIRAISRLKSGERHHQDLVPT